MIDPRCNEQRKLFVSTTRSDSPETFGMKIRIEALDFMMLTFVTFALLPVTKAVVPPPDGGYPGGNTAEGQAALLNLTTGGFNTAVGYLSLRSNMTGSLNTAAGAGTLLANAADENTATGAAALLSNTTGGFNTGMGAFALLSNTSGTNNTAIGVNALASNTVGGHNAATGFGALQNNTTGASNTAAGENALQFNTAGSFNTAIGLLAGSAQTTGSGNVYIGAGASGVAGESNACYIRSVFGATSANGIPVLVNANNKLGTTTSSKRFKEDITAMDKASETLFALHPVTFRYKSEIDPDGKPQFGLIAEDVASVNPDLVIYDRDANPYTVRYDAVNAMLLNEFLKEHRRVDELKSAMAQQRKDFEAAIVQQQKTTEALLARFNEQEARIQKVSAEVEMRSSASRMLVENR